MKYDVEWALGRLRYEDNRCRKRRSQGRRRGRGNSVVALQAVSVIRGYGTDYKRVPCEWKQTVNKGGRLTGHSACTYDHVEPELHHINGWWNYQPHNLTFLCGVHHQMTHGQFPWKHMIALKHIRRDMFNDDWRQKNIVKVLSDAFPEHTDEGKLLRRSSHLNWVKQIKKIYGTRVYNEVDQPDFEFSRVPHDQVVKVRSQTKQAKQESVLTKVQYQIDVTGFNGIVTFQTESGPITFGT